MKIIINEKAKAFLRELGFVNLVKAPKSRMLPGGWIADKGFLPAFVVRGLAPLLPEYSVSLMPASEDFPVQSICIKHISVKTEPVDNLDDEDVLGSK